MTSEAGDLEDLPELPSFDAHALRAAVRRGVIRTAVVGGIWVLVALFLLNVAGAVLLSALGRSHQLTGVVQVGWQVSHPEFVAQETGEQTSGRSAQLRMTVHPLSAALEPAGATVSFREGIFGGVSADDPDPKSAATQVLLNSGEEKVGAPDLRPGERKALLGLPTSVRAAAVVDFARPLSFDDYRKFAAAHEKNSEFAFAPVLFSGVLPADRIVEGSHFIRGVYGWNVSYDHRDSSGEFHTVDDLVGGFRRWVATLHNSDRNALQTAGVDLTGLRAAARDGLVHGVILRDVPPQFLLSVLDDPAVGAVHTYDAEFAVEGSS
jgi:hypothetical protein